MRVQNQTNTALQEVVILVGINVRELHICCEASLTNLHLEITYSSRALKQNMFWVGNIISKGLYIMLIRSDSTNNSCDNSHLQGQQ